MATAPGGSIEIDAGTDGIALSYADPQYQGESRPEVPTYLFQSIAVTLICCLPVGLVAVYYAAQVSSKVASGDVRGAMDASAKARTWCWIAVGAAAVFLIAWLLLILTAGVAVAPMDN